MKKWIVGSTIAAAAIASVLFFSTYSMGTTRYVRQGCTNNIVTYNPTTNSCTGGSDRVYSSIANAFSAGTTVAGDRLEIRAGTYVETIDSNSQTIPAGTSFANAPVIAAYTGETVTIRPGSAGDNIVGLASSSVKYVIFDRLIIDGSNARTFGIAITGGAHHVRFQNGEVKGTTASGILITDSANNSDGHEFISMHVHNNGTNSGDHGFYISTKDNLIESCDIHNNASYGIQIYNGYGTAGERADRNTIRKSKVYSNNAGMVLSSGDSIKAYNNLIYSNATSGIDILFQSPTNIRVYNNTIYANGGNAIVSGGTGHIIRNNILYNNGGVFSGSGYTASNNPTSNPSFVSAPSDFHLTAGSSAIGAGCATTACNTELTAIYTTDYDGNARGSIPPAWDAGAYEYQASGGDSMTIPTISSVGVGQQQTITWTCVGCGGGGINIDLDRGNDGSFDTSIVSGTINDGSHTWTVTGTANPTNVIRVRDSDASPTQTSNVFAITASPAGTITIVEPKSGDLFLSGQQGPVRWTSTGISGQVRIDLSRDGGATWELGTTTILYSDPDEVFTYNAPTSSNCQIRVVTTDGSNITGTSSVFRIGGTRAGFLLLP